MNGRRLGSRVLGESEVGALGWEAPAGMPGGLYFVRYRAVEGARNVKILYAR